MRILITGGLGYLGSWLAKNLIEQGHYVHIFDWCKTHKLKTYSIARKELEKKCDLDIKDFSTLRVSELRGINVVYHLAAISGIKACEDNPVEAWENNFVKTTKLINKCAEAKVEKFIFASTAAVYGSTQKCIESTSTNPKNVYASTKARAEEAILREKYIIPIVARFSNIYGMGYYDKPTVISKFIDRALKGEDLEIYGSGQQVRLLPLEDLPELLERADLDLPDALLGQTEAPAELIERLGVSIAVQTVVAGDDGPLAG